MKESERLIAARNLIADEKRWIQGEYCDGEELENSCQFCALGAIHVARGETWTASDVNPTTDYLIDALKVMGFSRFSVPDYNDEHSHAEVMQMFAVAIQIAQSEGN